MDRRLSRNGTMACAMCHIPEQGFAAVELGTSVGIEGRSLRRNAPTLLNVAYVARLFHDGRSTSLEQQAWEPWLNPIEMGNPGTAGVISRIAALPECGGKFEAAFGGAVASRETVAAALAAYQRTLVSADSRFEVSGNDADRWAYRTPGLRNVALTAPYMHDGSLATLEEVIALYQRGGIDHRTKSALLQPLALTDEEARSLAAFLRTLTGANVTKLAQRARSGAGR